MSSSNNNGTSGGFFGLLPSHKTTGPEHNAPAITINDSSMGGGDHAVNAGTTAGIHQPPGASSGTTPQVQTIAVPSGPSSGNNGGSNNPLNTVYQLTQAQLSPAATPADSNHSSEDHNTANIQSLVRDFGKFFQADAHEMGFAPSAKLASEHEEAMSKGNLKQSRGGAQIKYQFQVTKLRSWRTGYQRLLVLYEQSFATLDPDSLAVTNQWAYHTLNNWHIVDNEDHVIGLQVDHDKLKFNTHAVPRAHVLTALLECQDQAGLAPNRSIVSLQAQRWTRHGTRYAVQLYLKPYGWQEVVPADNNRVVRTYRYTELRGVSLAAGHDAGVVLYFRQPAKRRLYEVYNASGNGEGRSTLIAMLQQHCQTLGIALAMEHSLPINDWLSQRRSVDAGLLITSWPVTKATLRPQTSTASASGGSGPSQAGLVRRQLGITSRALLVERAPEGLVSCRPLVSLIALVRHVDSDQLTLEFANGSRRTYASPQRDGLIVSILDSATTVGHQIILSDTHSLPLSLSWKWERQEEDGPVDTGGGIFAPIAIPMYCLKRVHTASTRAYAFVAGTISDLTTGTIPYMLVVKEIHGVVEACRELNASVPPDGEGLPTGNNEKTITGAVGALWGLIHALLTVKGDAEGAEKMGTRIHERRAAEDAAAVFFATLLRLSSIPTGYQKTAELTTFQECVKHIISIESTFTKFWSFRVLGALLIGLPGDKRDKEAEFVNKSVVLKTGGLTLLKFMVESLTSSGKSSDSDLMQMVTSDLLQSFLCSHYDTTSPESFSALIDSLAENYRSLLATLRSPTPFVLENTALLLQVISLNAPEAALKIRDAALSSAVILKYFHGAIFSPVEGFRFLCRYLCSLWFSGPMSCPEKRLLKRIVPHGFLPFLNMPGLSEMEQNQLDQLERDAIEGNIPEGSSNSMESGASGTNTARLRARIAIAQSQPKTKETRPENYRIFFHVLTQDHSLPDLIWSQQTRRELRVALETEMQYMKREIEARGDLNVAWNYQQFSVSYPSLDHEVRVGDVYMRLWLQAGDGFIRSWEDPAGLFELLFRRFLCVVDRDHKVTIMCIRCMQRLYTIHWSRIGPVPDLMILIHSMAKTRSVETQHRLLELVASLLGVNLLRESEDHADVPDNAEQMLNSESIGQLCQFAAWAHNTGERVESLLSRTVGSSDKTSQRVSPAVWFVASSSKIPPPSDLIRGPFTVADLKKLTSKNELHPFDLVTSSHTEEYDEISSDRNEEKHIDTGKWKRLNDVWQLRWLLCMDSADGEGVLTPSEVAHIALKSLHRLVELHRSVDSSGAPYIPIPTAKRILSGRDKRVSASNAAGANPLSILAQSLLCSDSSVVDIGSNLLYKLLEYNHDTMSKLYLRGVFFFGLCYTGSNFYGIARLLAFSHLNQNFQSGFKATAGDENPMRDRSFLGSMLPEGLLFVLANYGFEKFAQVFTGEADTPEVIWTQEMRAHLVEMIRQHLGDFPLRLFQNNTAEYEFCPIPPVSYPKLKKELFCHNYYLRNLCDDNKFPDWPIAEPVKVFKACLEKFEEAVHDDTEGTDAVDQAIKLLELKNGDSDKELRRSYRKLARLYHPDRNPAGRDMFESIQQSYELLLRVVEDGDNIQFSSSESDLANADRGQGTSNTNRMELLLKAQLLICRRYEQDMKKMKYPSYEVLLGCLSTPVELVSVDEKQDPATLLSHSWAQPESCEVVRAGAELVFRTCVISPLNAAEIVAQSGLAVLCSLSRGALNLVNASIASRDPAVSVKNFLEILHYSLRTLSGIIYFDKGREALLNAADLRKLLVDIFFEIIVGSLSERESFTTLQIKQTVLEGICFLAKDPKCQVAVLEHGLLWPLLGQLLAYDASVESNEVPQTEVMNTSVAGNTRAQLAVQAIGEIAVKHVPNSLDTLFTPSISRLLREKRYREFLHVVNSNVEEAYVIWNISMRSQLEDLIQTQIESRSKDRGLRSIEIEFECLKDHEYEALSHEVIIGGVYIRVFNKVGIDALKNVVDVSGFAQSLVDFAKARIPATSLGSIPKLPGDVELLNLSIGALQILVHSGFLGDDFLEQCHSLPGLVFTLMSFPEDTDANRFGCDIGTELSSKQGFAQCVAQQQCLWRLVQILEEREDSDGDANNFDATAASNKKRKGWMMLEALSAFGAVASLLHHSTCWLEILGVLCGHPSFTTGFYSRVGAANALSRMLWDSAGGTAVSTLLLRFLPVALVVMLRDSPESMVKEFDSEVDSPELIWDSSMRAQLRSVLAEQIDKILDDVETRKSPSFVLEADVGVVYEKLENELCVGGVYISRFLKDPTHQLRDATGFLDSVLKQRQQELEKFWPSNGLMVSRASTDIVAHGSEETLHDLTTAAIYVCKVNDTLCDKLAPWGYCSRFLESVQKALEREMHGSPLVESMRLLHVASNRSVNVESIAGMSNTDGTHGIVDFTIKAIGGGPLHPDSALMVELLFRLFKNALQDPNSQIRRPEGNRGYPTVMAPSPAPGEGPVRHNREKINLGDDPLAMFGLGPAASSPAPAPSPLQAPQMVSNASQSSQPNMHANHAPPSRSPVQSSIPARPGYSAASQISTWNGAHSLPNQVPPQSQPFQTPGIPQNPSTPNSLYPRSPQQQISPNPLGTTSTYSQQPAPQPLVSRPRPSHLFQDPLANSYTNSSQSCAAPPQPHMGQPAQPHMPPTAGSTQSSLPYQQEIPGSNMAPQQQGRLNPRVNQTLNYQPTHPAPQQSQDAPQGAQFHRQPQTLSPVMQSPQQFLSPTASQQPYRQGQQSTYLSGTLQNQHDVTTNTPSLQSSLNGMPHHTAQRGVHSPPQQAIHGHVQAHPVANHPALYSQGGNSTTGPESMPRAPPPAAPPPPPPPMAGPPVETVAHDGETSMGQSMGTGGSIIDARSPTDPTIVAEERAIESEGVDENVSLQEIKDYAAGKVHAINLLQLLTTDPGYGMKFKLLLKDLPAWSKYKSQDHSLLMATTKRTDYFLTAGEQASETLMLTQEAKEEEESDN